MSDRDLKLDQEILEAAKTEFLTKGYQDASLRAIAKKAGVTTGAIYTRYKSKGELFYEICQEAILAMESYFDISRYEPDSFIKCFDNLSDLRRSFENHAKQISKYVEPLKLLLFKSSGSDYEDYRESMIQDYVSFFTKGLASNSEDTDFIDNKSTDMLFRSIASFYVAYVEELVLHADDSNLLTEYREKVVILVYSIFQALLNDRA